MEGRQITTVIGDVEDNDILKDSSQSKIDRLLQKIENVSVKHEKFG